MINIGNSCNSFGAISDSLLVREFQHAPPKQIAKDDPRRLPFDKFPRFGERDADGDSTPYLLREFSRLLGDTFEGFPFRTPEIETAIIAASFMHDIAYYYGGSEAQKDNADDLFEKQILYVVGLLDPKQTTRARVTAAFDKAAVKLGGGWPFREDYSWGFGIKDPADREYLTLAPGQEAKITKFKREKLEEVLRLLSEGKFKATPKQLQILESTVSPERAQELRALLKEAAGILVKQLQDKGTRKQVPGYF